MLNHARPAPHLAKQTGNCLGSSSSCPWARVEVGGGWQSAVGTERRKVLPQRGYQHYKSQGLLCLKLAAHGACTVSSRGRPQTPRRGTQPPSCTHGESWKLGVPARGSQPSFEGPLYEQGWRLSSWGEAGSPVLRGVSLGRLGKALCVTGDLPQAKGCALGDTGQGTIPLWGGVVASYCLSKV